MSDSIMPKVLQQALADKGITFDSPPGSKGGGDKRFCYGARCTWFGPIQQVGKLPEGLPCCPLCKGVLFEYPTEKSWWVDVDSFTTSHPGYRAMLEWQRDQNKCFPWPQVLALAYATETGNIVKLEQL